MMCQEFENLTHSPRILPADIFEESLSLLGQTFECSIKEFAYGRYCVVRHASPSSNLCRSQARAKCQSRLTVRPDSSSNSAVSSMESPA